LRYFKEERLRCTHCGEAGMDMEFMQKVDELRHELGFPFIVNSAYRCPEHPIEFKKSSPGAHTTGMAIDIGVRGNEAYRLLQGALRAGFTGIGVNQKGSSRFIHLDNIEHSGERPRPWIWSY